MMYAPALIIGGILVLAGYALLSQTSQLFGRVWWRRRTDLKLIALTFDDGPNEPYTQQLLDILAKHKALATFFIVGNNAKRHPESLRKIVAAGHELGNHSLAHEFHRYLKPGYWEHDLRQTNDIIKQQTGKTVRYYRSPWLWRTPKILATARKLGMRPIWGIFACEREILQPNADVIAARARQKARPGRIMIFHDGREGRGGYRGATVQAIDKLIPMLRADGYEIVGLKQLLAND